jgi:hypothetical protein
LHPFVGFDHPIEFADPRCCHELAAWLVSQSVVVTSEYRHVDPNNVC